MAPPLSQHTTTNWIKKGLPSAHPPSPLVCWAGSERAAKLFYYNLTGVQLFNINITSIKSTVAFMLMNTAN